MIRLAYRPAALADLEAIEDYIAAYDQGRAAKFIQIIRARCRMLCDFPELGPARPDIASGIRILTMRRKVAVAYRITTDAVVVTRVFYGGQDFATILRRAPG